MENKQADTLIIGGGVIGLSVAYYTAVKGASVILLEKDRICSGSSYGNAGLLAPSHNQPLPTPQVMSEGLRNLFNPAGAFSIRFRPEPELFQWLWKFYRACSKKHFLYAIDVLKELGWESLRLHRDLAQKGGPDYQFEQTGLLNVYTGSKAFRQGLDTARLMEKYDVKSRALSGSETRQMEPSLGAQVVGGIFYQADGRIHPWDFVNWLAMKAREKGVRIYTETEVFGFEPDQRQVKKILTTRGDFHADQVVLATGAWTPVLTKNLNRSLPLQAAKGYSLTFKRPDGSPRLPLLLEESRIAVTPYRDTLRLAGILELSGLQWGLNARRINHMRETARLLFPKLGKMELQEIWRGLRPCTPDGLPIIGRLRPFANLWVAGGHGTKGMFLGPVTGKLMADLLSGASIGAMEIALSPNRF